MNDASSASVELDHGPRNAAILWFATVIVLMLVAYVALYDVDSTLEKIIVAAVVLGATAAAVVVHHVSTPTGELPHPAKVRRERRHIAMLNGTLAAVLLLLACTAAFDLNSWAEWTFVGAIAMVTVSVGVAVQTHS